jgi:hypothetical protein
MSIIVEANLKIPSITIKRPDEPVRRIDNGSVRFIKRVSVDAVPKSGSKLSLSTGSGGPFDAVVTRVEWSEGKEVLVVSCTYEKRSMTSADYDCLVSDPEWVVNQLP